MPKQGSVEQHQQQSTNNHLKVVECGSSDDEQEFDDSSVEYEDPYRNAEAVAKGSFLFDFIRQLRIGADLLRVSMPAHILEHRSFLEKLTDFNSHPFLLTEVQSGDTEEERFLNVCRWYLSGWHRLPKVGVKKPYNPILGEIFSCHWEHQDNSQTSYFAEQVSHHPPVSAFHMENKQHAITVSGSARPTASFRGQTATMNLEGEAVVQLHRRNESYSMTFPDVLVRGIIWGTMCVDTVGNTRVSCVETGYSAVFEFNKKKEVSGTITCREEPRFKIYGDIHGRICIYNADKGAKKHHNNGKWGLNRNKSSSNKDNDSADQVLLDVDSLPQTAKTVTPTARQRCNESRRVWFPVTKALSAKDYDRASLEKAAIEDQEREVRRRRQQDEAQQTGVGGKGGEGSSSNAWEPEHFKWDVNTERWVLR